MEGASATNRSGPSDVLTRVAAALIASPSIYTPGPVVSEMRQSFTPNHRQRWRASHAVSGAAASVMVVHVVGPLDENREVRGAVCARALVAVT